MLPGSFSKVHRQRKDGTVDTEEVFSAQLDPI